MKTRFYHEFYPPNTTEKESLYIKANTDVIGSYARLLRGLKKFRIPQENHPFLLYGTCLIINHSNHVIILQDILTTPDLEISRGQFFEILKERLK